MSPAILNTLQQQIHTSDHVHIQGNGTKTGLQNPHATTLDTRQLNGIVEYQPDEYTITAYSSTPVHDIQTALAEKQQYLPCDPLLVSAGATLGGTIASNLAGSRRFRYGGIRDFLLGATVMDGQGRIFTVGGKVVKNAAGFDLAKFLVGSLGHHLVILDATFKIFPDKPTFHTRLFAYPTLDDALQAIFFLNRQPFELDALDLAPQSDYWVLVARFAGIAETLPAQIKRFSIALQEQTAVQTVSSEDDLPYWQTINALHHTTNMVKVPITPRQLLILDPLIKNIPRRYTVGGNIAWIDTPDIATLSSHLANLNLTGLHILGDAQSPILGKSINNPISERVKKVLDPHKKFV